MVTSSIRTEPAQELTPKKGVTFEDTKTGERVSVTVTGRAGSSEGRVEGATRARNRSVKGAPITKQKLPQALAIAKAEKAAREARFKELQAQREARRNQRLQVRKTEVDAFTGLRRYSGESTSSFLARQDKIIGAYEQATGQTLQRPTQSLQVQQPRTNAPVLRQSQFGGTVVTTAPTFKTYIKDRNPFTGTISYGLSKVRGAAARTEERFTGTARLFGGRTGERVQTIGEVAPYFTPAGPAFAVGAGLGQFTPGGLREARSIGLAIQSKTNVPAGIGTAGVLVGSAAFGVAGASSGTRKILRATIPESKTTFLSVEQSTKPVRTGSIINIEQGKTITIPKGSKIVSTSYKADTSKGIFNPRVTQNVGSADTLVLPQGKDFETYSLIKNTARTSIGQRKTIAEDALSTGIKESTGKTTGYFKNVGGKDYIGVTGTQQGKNYNVGVVGVRTATKKGEEGSAIYSSSFAIQNGEKVSKGFNVASGLSIPKSRLSKALDNFRSKPSKINTVKSNVAISSDRYKSVALASLTNKISAPITPQITGRTTKALTGVIRNVGVSGSAGIQIPRSSTSRLTGVIKPGITPSVSTRTVGSTSLGTGLIQPPRQTPRTLPRPGGRALPRTTQPQIQIPRETSITGVTQITTPTTRQIPRNTGRLAGTGTPGLPVTRITTPRAPPVFKLPSLGDLSTGRGKRTFSGAQSFANVPSFSALAFGITGKKRSRGPSGLQFAPVYKGFSFSNLFQQQKRRRKKKK